MPRRTRATDPKAATTKAATAPVESRTLEARTDWSLADAGQLVRQGYTPARVAERTGYPVKVVTAAASQRTERSP